MTYVICSENITFILFIEQTQSGGENMIRKTLIMVDRTSVNM